MEHETHLRLKNYYEEFTKEPRQFWIKPYRSFMETAETIYSPVYHAGMIFFNLFELLKSIVEGNFSKTPFYSGTFCIQIWLAMNATVLFSLVLSARGISTMIHLMFKGDKEQLSIVSEQKSYGAISLSKVENQAIEPNLLTGIFHHDKQFFNFFKSDAPSKSSSDDELNDSSYETTTVMNPNQTIEHSSMDFLLFVQSIFGTSSNVNRRSVYKIEQQAAFQNYIELLKQIDEDTSQLLDATNKVCELQDARVQYQYQALAEKNQLLPLSFYQTWGHQALNDRFKHNLLYYPSHHHLTEETDLHEIKQITQDLNAHHRKVMEDAQVLFPHIFEQLEGQLQDAAQHKLISREQRVQSKF